MLLTSQSLAKRLDQELKVETIPDNSLNGLQVEGARQVGKIALAVDASVATFRAALDAKADFIIVHHGLFWGQTERIVGRTYQRIRLLIENGISLYAAHLPLDCHPRLGNNAQLAKRLGLKLKKPFGTYHGIQIGIGGTLAEAMTCQKLGRKISDITGHPCRIFAFGKKKIRKIAIVSGGGGDMTEEAAREGYDAYLTGEISHQIFHVGQENNINIFTGGHYATETLGVLALGQFIKKVFGITSIFLELPTGL